MGRLSEYDDVEREVINPKPKQLEVIDVVVGQPPTPIKWDDMTEEQQEHFARVAALNANPLPERIIWRLNDDPLALICETRCDLQLHKMGEIQQLDIDRLIEQLERAEELLRTVGYKKRDR